ncbi:hypothetical protein CLOM621_05478 [Clostridium sp. M62/1]|nr:hypothetical protein CLOM621_05478 [Clostridium sp. M62/1]
MHKQGTGANINPALPVFFSLLSKLPGILYLLKKGQAKTSNTDTGRRNGGLPGQWDPIV